MKLCLRIVPLLFLVTGTLTDDGFNLLDALDPATIAPKEKPKAPEKPKAEDVKPNIPASGDSNFNLWDAVSPGPTLKPDEPAVSPPNSEGGSKNFEDSELIIDGYKPDGGSSGGGGADQPQEAGSGQIAGIVSAIGVALLGAASSYFAYQKKKLCFKLQGGADPESGKGQPGTHSEPQVLSNLLRTN